MTRVIIAGSRDYTYKETLYQVADKVLSTINGDIEIVSGGCRGADALGERYALDHGYSLKIFPAHWKKFGKKAGYIRNKEMAEYASKENGILIAFPLGESRGTNIMISLANEYGLKIYIAKSEVKSE